MSRRQMSYVVSIGLAGAMAAGCTDSTQAFSPVDVAPALSRAPSAPLTIGPSPTFALATLPNGTLLAGQVPIGVVEIGSKGTTLLAALENVTGIAPNGAGNLLVITGAGESPDAAKLWRITGNREPQLVADLAAWEAANNPDASYNPIPDSNPFDIAALGGNRALVADAAGNDILEVDHKGNIELVALLTRQPVPFAGSPTGFIQAQPVATSVAVGPDGTIYAGELTGFPGTPGYSRIWRIAAGSRGVTCPSSACTLLSSGLTSIVDLEISPDGRTLYAVELDAASWLAIEGSGGAPVAGGRVRACSTTTGVCTILESGIPLPTAVTIAKDGTPWIATNSRLFGGVTTVRPVQ
ncbi:MAG: ScyD/ScyE family protein [Gemmatimonadota bacterium]